MSFDPWDYYNRKAKQSGFRARAVYKLEAIDQKFRIFNGREKAILDVWCAPGSWMQYAQWQVKNKQSTIIGIDLKEVIVSGENMFTYTADFTQEWLLEGIMQDHSIDRRDVIMSDAAPNTTGVKDLDAMNQIELVNTILDKAEQYLTPHGVFVAKVFMWPGFDELIARMKQLFGGKGTKIYKPDASRKASKEIFVIGRRSKQKEGRKKK